jgi:hypothetical protein
VAWGGGSMHSAMALLTCTFKATSIDCRPNIGRRSGGSAPDSFKAGVDDLQMHIGQRDRAGGVLSRC